MKNALPGHRRAFAPAVFLSLALATFGFLSGAPKSDPPPAKETPSRVILTWSGDPAHSQHVTWRTDAPLATAKAEIAPLTASPAFAKSVKTVEGTAGRVELAGGAAAGHYAADFTGLEPAAQYSYRVGNGRAWSEWSTFRTAAAQAAPFRFLYLGDAQNDIRSLWSRAVRAAYRQAPDARFIAMAGDLVAEGYDDRLWGELAEGFGFISAGVPLLPAPGNHDLHQRDNHKSFTQSGLWTRHFGLPHNGPESTPELDQQAYFMDYQGVRFVVIDANCFDGQDNAQVPARERIRDAQVAWVKKTLESNPNPWAVVLQHQPVFPIAHQRDYPEMQTMLAPLYEKYGVALVMQGHDHSYGRFTRNGVTYVISVSGPKMYELESKHVGKMAKTATGKQLYQVVEVSAEKIVLRAYGIDGTLVDEIPIRRRT